MINTCRKKGIRIYSQVSINQMTYGGNDIYENHYEYNSCSPNDKWKNKASSCGSPFFTIMGRVDNNAHTNKPPIFEYPAVPYCGTDFHCKRTSSNVEDLGSVWVDSNIVDLNTGSDYVRQRIADFLTELISIGISGFSIYNGKYISTDDYIGIFTKFKSNLGDTNLPSDFIAILEMDFSDTEKNTLICDDSKTFNFANKFIDKLKDNTINFTI